MAYKRKAHSASSTSSAKPRTRTASSTRADKTSNSAKRPPSRSPKKHKAAKKNHRVLKWVLGIVLCVLGLGILSGCAAFAYLYATTEIPQPEKFALAEKTTVYYADGTTPIGSYAEQNREIISCTDLPDYVGNSIVASENRTFYTDKGIDLKGILRALWTNITTGSRQGGSTITQQYVERYYVGETTSYIGKAREAVLAIKIAHSESKDQVLCNYMNTIYLGRNTYGIQAAAKAYFNKDAKDLTLSEAVMLAGIIPSPSTWDPAVNKDMAQQRFDRVLNIMKEDGYITDQEKSDAKFPDTVEYTQQNAYAGPNGYLLDMVQRELESEDVFTKEELETGGYSIYTTIDKTKQDIMQSVGDTRPDGMPDSIQVGGIAVNVSDGSVVSVYAGTDYLKKQYNNCDQAVFEPGSTMKPFALLGAAQERVNFSTLFNGNSGQHFSGIEKTVDNALGNNFGNIDLYQATANSVNTVFMNVNEHLTPQKTASIAHNAGIQGDIDADSMYNVLGINALTVWDLAQGHTTIANNGVKNSLHMVSSVVESDGTHAYDFIPEKTTVFDANDCALVQKAMQGTTTYGTAAGVSTQLGRPVAGKSGTANDENAASFVGYTPSLLNVWAIWNPDSDGNPQVVPEFAGYGVSSTGYPSHLFAEYMSQALSGAAVEQFPTATDNGTIGGPDGTWGLGTSAAQLQQQAAKKQEEEQQKQEAQNQQESQQNSNSGGSDDSKKSDNSNTSDNSNNSNTTDNKTDSSDGGNSSNTDSNNSNKDTTKTDGQ